MKEMNGYLDRQQWCGSGGKGGGKTKSQSHKEKREGCSGLREEHTQ